MSPLPEFNMNLRSDDFLSSFKKEKKEAEVIVHHDSALRQHTISIIISDQEAGSVFLKVGDKKIEIPTYKLTVIDDKTEETEVYQVTRDTLSYVKSETKKSFLSFFGFKRFDTTTFLYDTIAFEPQYESIKKFDISRHRKLSQSMITYELSGEGQKIALYAGDLNTFRKSEDIQQYFIVVDNSNGGRFIGDMLYREKVLKLTPKIELQIIKRKKIPKSIEYDDKGIIHKLIYM
nr:hypothetical protein [uncultured Chryseobacterium sp.]